MTLRPSLIIKQPQDRVLLYYSDIDGLRLDDIDPINTVRAPADVPVIIKRKPAFNASSSVCAKSNINGHNAEIMNKQIAIIDKSIMTNPLSIKATPCTQSNNNSLINCQYI